MKPDQQRQLPESLYVACLNVAGPSEPDASFNRCCTLEAQRHVLIRIDVRVVASLIHLKKEVYKIVVKTHLLLYYIVLAYLFLAILTFRTLLAINTIRRHGRKVLDLPVKILVAANCKAIDQSLIIK